MGYKVRLILLIPIRFIISILIRFILFILISFILILIRFNDELQDPTLI